MTPFEIAFIATLARGAVLVPVLLTAELLLRRTLTAGCRRILWCICAIWLVIPQPNSRALPWQVDFTHKQPGTEGHSQPCPPQKRKSKCKNHNGFRQNPVCAIRHIRTEFFHRSGIPAPMAQLRTAVAVPGRVSGLPVAVVLLSPLPPKHPATAGNRRPPGPENLAAGFRSFAAPVAGRGLDRAEPDPVRFLASKITAADE